VSESSSRGYPELEDALARLPRRYRLVLMLYYFDGRSTENIAETLQINEAAVYARMSRARKRLRKLLETQGDA
ncbi:MAG: RNA polymerase sigma factor, partial [Planctomycetota bacterium]